MAAERPSDRPSRDVDPVRARADRLSPPRARGERRRSCGPSPRATAGASCSGSRTTTGPAAGPSTTPRCSRISSGSGSGRTWARSARARATSRTRRRSTASGRGPRLRLRLHARDVPGLGRDARPAVVRPRLSGRLPRDAAVAEATVRVAIGDGRESWTDRLAGRASARSRPAATRSSATGMGSGPTASASSSTTSARASTSWSAAGTCSTRPPTRSGSARLLGRETPPDFAHHPLILRPTARSSPRPTARPASASCGRPGWTPAGVIADGDGRPIGFEP